MDARDFFDQIDLALHIQAVGGRRHPPPGFLGGDLKTQPLKDLGDLGGLWSNARAINGIGQVIGGSTTADWNYHQFFWSGKTGMIDLDAALPAGSGWTLWEVVDIDDSGRIVGNGDLNGESRIFLITLAFLDYNNNGVLDECDVAGDFDGDGAVTPGDLPGMVNCLTGPGGGAVGPCELGDFDGDDDVDLMDFAAFQAEIASG